MSRIDPGRRGVAIACGVLLGAVLPPQSAAGICAGDCDGDQTVVIAELNGPSAVIVSLDGEHVYVTSDVDGAVVTFAINR